MTPDQFEAYETIIKSGQIPEHQIPKFLDENADFKAWYLARLSIAPAPRRLMTSR
jgi:hypothetical protein